MAFEKIDIRFYLLLALSFLLPLSRFLVPFVLLFLIIEWVLNRRWRNGVFDSTYLGFYLLFFFYQLLSLIWSENSNYGLADISAKLCLLLFPIILSGKDDRFDYKSILEYFVYGVIGLVFYNVIFATVNYFETEEVKYFFYSRFSPLFHVSYASLYSIFAILITFYFYVKEYKFYKNFLLVMSLCLSFAVHVALLNSKGSFLAMICVFLIVILIVFKTKWSKKISFISIFSLIISFLVIINSETLYTRFFGGFEILKSEKNRTISNEFKRKEEIEKRGVEIPTESSQVRIIAWKAAFDIIKMNPFGVGIGDRKDVFLDKLESQGHSRFKEKGLNAHNQYIQVLLAIGIPGLIIFLINLCYPLPLAFRLNNFLLIGFVTNLSVNMLFESMLEVQAGLFFYAFFSVLLFKQMKVEKSIFQEQ